MRTMWQATRSSGLRQLSAVVVAGVALVACSSAAVPSALDTASDPAAPASAAASPSSGGGRGDADYDYGTGAEPSQASEAPPASEPASSVPTTTIEVGTATGELGTWLTGVDGLTLYTFEPDGANSSSCVDDCAEAWPPFTVESGATLVAGEDVTGTLSTFERADGSLQVSYDGAPLYYFASDTGPGDTNGQGLGDRWFVAEP
jgi:predicted lipoprotein with Yx(FWY)xxD motif